MGRPRRKSAAQDPTPEIAFSGEELRHELLRVVRLIVAPPAEQTEEEEDELISRWNDLCPHPGQSDIIFWPDKARLGNVSVPSDGRLSPEQMVELAMGWEPAVVSMRVMQRSGGERVGYFRYELIAPDIPQTVITTPLKQVFEKDESVTVALRGVRLADGSTVKTEFTFKSYSCGKILGPTNLPPGTRIVNHPEVQNQT